MWEEHTLRHDVLRDACQVERGPDAALNRFREVADKVLHEVGKHTEIVRGLQRASQ